MTTLAQHSQLLATHLLFNHYNLFGTPKYRYIIIISDTTYLLYLYIPQTILIQKGNTYSKP